jgi:hypothetical protein
MCGTSIERVGNQVLYRLIRAGMEALRQELDTQINVVLNWTQESKRLVIAGTE